MQDPKEKSQEEGVNEELTSADSLSSTTDSGYTDSNGTWHPGTPPLNG